MIIPKLIHQIWVGDKPFPKTFQRYRETLAKHHPTWEMILWTDKNLPTWLVNGDLLPLAPTEAKKANILRYEIICHEGGVYLDTDFECYKNIEPLIHDVEAFAAYQKPKDWEPCPIANGLFGAVKGHPWTESLVKNTKKHFNPQDIFTLGPPYFTGITRQFPEVRILEAKYVYPYTWEEPHRKGENFPEAYLAHHWAFSWGGGPLPE